MVESSKATVLLVEDDSRLLRAVKLYLDDEDYEIITASNGREGVQKMYRHRPDLIVLDIMMPEMDGWQACERIREFNDVPIIMLTALGQTSDKVRGLGTGADDYLVKPFDLEELAARIQALLRRAGPPRSRRPGALFADDELVIDAKNWNVLRRGDPVRLTAKEGRLLFLLTENAGRVLTTESILGRIWGREYVDDPDRVKQFIWRLRQKIEPNPSQPQYILTKRGVGYQFARQPSAGSIRMHAGQRLRP